MERKGRGSTGIRWDEVAVVEVVRLLLFCPIGNFVFSAIGEWRELPDVLGPSNLR